MVRDITEQRLAQAMLAEAEARLRESEALAHVGRWQWDVATNAVQWSDEFHRIHGVDPLDFDGTFDAHLACVHQADRARVHAAIERSVVTGRAAHEEYRIVRPDGEIRWIDTRAEPTIDSAGDVVALRGIGQDVTEHRRAPVAASLNRARRCCLTRSTRSLRGERLGTGAFEHVGELAQRVAGVRAERGEEVVELLGVA